MRITKDYDVRKNEILDAAQRLFFEMGYESTPVSAIIDAVEVSKGTFYYYFDSKEQLLDQLAERFSAELSARLETFMEDDSLSARGKLERLFSEAGSLKLERLDLMLTLMRVLYRDENILLRRKMFRNARSRVLPWLTRTVRQGTREGLFDTPSPEEAAETIWTIMTGINEQVVELILESREKPENRRLVLRKLEFFEHVIERILGSPSGSIHVVDHPAIGSFLDGGRDGGRTSPSEGGKEQ